MTTFRAPLALLLSSLALSASAQEPGSKTPPAGPPWTTNFFEAREQALKSGKAIFLYSTKTY